ncbi:MAG: hypothetical protein MUC63_01305 [Planctomycetes bacterium]|jgi:hypothetical protein|nr:hypothetical protein [Planctomycetota bacterium]
MAEEETRAAEPGAAKAFHEPYPNPHVNVLYNLLFCDDLELFDDGKSPKNGVLAALFVEPPDCAALEEAARDPGLESRVRALAFNRLRAAGRPVPAGILLGVVVEVPLRVGLDALAAYADGRVRYLNQSGKIAIFEGGPPPVEAAGRDLVAAAQGLSGRTGPMEGKRRPPPAPGNARITLVASQGLGSVEGRFASLVQDPLAGPVLGQARLVLQAILENAGA